MSEDSIGEAASNKRVRYINLGAGPRPTVGPRWENQDLYPGPNIDHVFNLNDPWDFADNSIDLLTAFHVIEHVRRPVFFMQEAQRVLKDGGHMILRMPHGASDAWGSDPCHFRPFWWQTFTMFGPGTTQWTYNPQHDPVRWPDRFLVVEARLIVNDKIAKLPLWKWWFPKVQEFIWNGIVEVWIHLHKLAAGENAPKTFAIPINICDMATANRVALVCPCRKQGG